MIPIELQTELLTLLNKLMAKGYIPSFSMDYADYKGIQIVTHFVDKNCNIIKPNESYAYTVGGETFYKSSQQDLEAYRKLLINLIEAA